MKMMIKDIKANETIKTYFILESFKLLKSRTQEDYLALNLTDKTGSIKGYVWDKPVATFSILRKKSLVEVRGITKRLKGSVIINVKEIRVAGDSNDAADIRDDKDRVSELRKEWFKRIFESVNLIFVFLKYLSQYVDLYQFLITILSSY